MLQKIHLLSFSAIRRYLLEKTQHIVGGFGKLPGDPPGKACLTSMANLIQLSHSLYAHLHILSFSHCVSCTMNSDARSKDILHSYLGLASLAAMKEPGLQRIDPTLCISIRARQHLESMPWRQDLSATPQDGSGDMQKQMANITLLGG